MRNIPRDDQRVVPIIICGQLSSQFQCAKKSVCRSEVANIRMSFDGDLPVDLITDIHFGYGTAQHKDPT